MFSQYFGHYLLNKGIVTPEQLTEALEYQRSVHLKLGVIAINAGYMVPSQVEQIHSMQKRVDKRFGELAIEQGYITEAQLNELLSTQKQGHLMLGQALIDKNFLTMEQLQSALNNYKKENGMSTRQFNVVRKDDAQEIEQIFQNYGETILTKTYSDYVTLFIKNIIRFVDESPTVEINQLKTDMTFQWYASQEILGKIAIHTGIACDTAEFVAFAAKFAQEDIVEPDELAQASVGEFLNLHNGIFLVNMSNNGVELEMDPQMVAESYTFKNQGKAYIVSCHMTWGKIDLILA
jgi:CheY-specific phosphatase CheX